MSLDPARFTGIALTPDILSAVDPFHIVLDDALTIVSIGTTLAKIVSANAIIGCAFGDVVTISRPKTVDLAGDLKQVCGKRLDFEIRPDATRNAKPLELRGAMNPISLPQAGTGYYLSLNLGQKVSEVVDAFSLTQDDFAIADVSMEMVYVLELQTALLTDSTQMAENLDNARLDAEERLRLDHTTGLLNRLGLVEYLGKIQASGGPFTVLHIDLDRFKQLNDTFGHAAGDAMLVRTARLMDAFAASDGACARIGGDEFVMVLQNDSTQSDLLLRAQSLIKDIATPINYGSAVLDVSASIGLRQVHQEEEWTADGLLLDADIALYTAKRLGRRRVQAFVPRMRQDYRQRLDTIEHIRVGLEQGEFEAFFQPQVDLETHALLGFEALARWRQRERGVLAPTAFLGEAQHAGLLGQIDAAVRENAMKHFADWVHRGFNVGHLSLNVPQSDLARDDFVSRILNGLQEARLTPNFICLELMENVLLDEADDAIVARIELLANMGFKIALDDFGTGHTSIVSLIDAPISLLKLDRSFVANIDRQDRLQRLTRTVLLMAGEMDIPVLAEGAERQEEVNTLLHMGCSAFQGYHVSRPLSAADARAFILRSQAQAQAARTGT